LLNPAPDGTITQVSVKVKAPGPDPLGPGELWDLLQYKLPGSNKFFSSASNAISIQGLGPATSTLIELVFQTNPCLLMPIIGGFTFIWREVGNRMVYYKRQDAKTQNPD